MKKVLLTTALVAATSTASMASGFFVGAYGGVSSVGTKVSNGEINSNVPVLLATFTNDLSGVGGQGGLVLGYDYACENGFVLGLDVFGQVGNAKGDSINRTNAGINVEISSKQKHAFGVAARLGYRFDTTQAYIKLGYSHSRFDAYVYPRANNPNIPAATTQKLNLNGFIVGVGADMPVGESMTVGFSYDFTTYKGKRYNVQYAAPLNQVATADFRPRTHAVNLVLKYKF